jgi:hypothetical protein
MRALIYSLSILSFLVCPTFCQELQPRSKMTGILITPGTTVEGLELEGGDYGGGPLIENQGDLRYPKVKGITEDKKLNGIYIENLNIKSTHPTIPIMGHLEIVEQQKKIKRINYTYVTLLSVKIQSPFEVRFASVCAYISDIIDLYVSVEDGVISARSPTGIGRCKIIRNPPIIFHVGIVESQPNEKLIVGLHGHVRNDLPLDFFDSYGLSPDGG